MSSSSTLDSEHRVSDSQRTLEQRFANPFLCRLLRSPFHPLASRWFVLVSYVGRRSGRRYTFPVAYARDGPDLVVVTPKADSNWWKNFRSPTTCRVWYGGARRAALGEVVTGATATELLDTYASAHGLMARSLGVGTAKDREHSLEDATQSLAVVRFSFG